MSINCVTVSMWSVTLSFLCVVTFGFVTEQDCVQLAKELAVTSNPLLLSLTAPTDCNTACVTEAIGCVTETTGCDTVTIGCVTVTTGCVSVTSGCVTVTTGCVAVTRGCVTVTTGCGIVTIGCVTETTGCGTVTIACDTVTTGCVTVTIGFVTVSMLFTVSPNCGSSTLWSFATKSTDFVPDFTMLVKLSLQELVSACDDGINSCTGLSIRAHVRLLLAVSTSQFFFRDFFNDKGVI